MSARDVATAVLLRVEKDGAWASRVLDAELSARELDSRDAGLATQLVYGCLRRLPHVDEVIDRHAKKTDPWLRATLRVAVFEILYLDRIPVRASVHEAVTAVRKRRGPKVAGFANAVLRKVRRPAQVREATLMMPAWVKQELVHSAGEARAGAWTGGEPSIDLRLFAPRDAWIESLPEEVVVAPFGHRGVRLLSGGDPRRLPGFDEGAFVVQEAGSQLIIDMLDLDAGMKVADCCAGRGGKTLSLAAELDALDNKGASRRSSVTAMELHPHKLDQISPMLTKLGINTTVTTAAVDLTVGTGGLEASFDRVLVDAPCSGLGTIHRRPEILLRLSPSDLSELSRLQAAVLQTSFGLLRPGGELIFATCSFSRDEGACAVDRATIPDDIEQVPAGDAADDDGVLRLGPWTELWGSQGQRGTDAYQVIRFRRRASPVTA